MYPILGPYPADLVRVYEAKGMEAAEDHIRKGIAEALELVVQGKREQFLWKNRSIDQPS